MRHEIQVGYVTDTYELRQIASAPGDWPPNEQHPRVNKSSETRYSEKQFLRQLVPKDRP